MREGLLEGYVLATKYFNLEMALITCIQSINQNLSRKLNLTARDAGNCRGETVDCLVSNIVKATAPFSCFFF